MIVVYHCLSEAFFDLIGEADNPGPGEAQARLSIGAINPSGIMRKSLWLRNIVTCAHAMLGASESQLN